MTAPSLVLWGASGHARVVADIVRLRGEFTIAGFLDDIDPARLGAPFCDATVLGGPERLAGLRAHGVRHLLVAVGDCESRLRLAHVATAHGFLFPTAVHPSAVCAADAAIGDGAVLAAGSVIAPGARLGPHALVNTSSSVDHDAELEAGVHVGPGARIGARVRVGRATLVGMGAVVVPGVRVGAGTLIGAGAVVVKDVPDGVVAYGCPARPVRKAP